MVHCSPAPTLPPHLHLELYLLCQHQTWVWSVVTMVSWSFQSRLTWISKKQQHETSHLLLPFRSFYFQAGLQTAIGGPSATTLTSNCSYDVCGIINSSNIMQMEVNPCGPRSLCSLFFMVWSLQLSHDSSGPGVIIDVILGSLLESQKPPWWYSGHWPVNGRFSAIPSFPRGR